MGWEKNQGPFDFWFFDILFFSHAMFGYMYSVVHHQWSAFCRGAFRIVEGVNINYESILCCIQRSSPTWAQPRPSENMRWGCITNSNWQTQTWQKLKQRFCWKTGTLDFSTIQFIHLTRHLVSLYFLCFTKTPTLILIDLDTMIE